MFFSINKKNLSTFTSKEVQNVRFIVIYSEYFNVK